MNRHLRKLLLITAICLTHTTGNVWGAEASTPPRTEATHEAVEPTPGEKVARRQQEVFVRGQFVKVFGEEAVEELTTRKGIDWDVLVDIDIPFDDASKRRMIRNVKTWILDYMGERTTAYLLLSDDVMRMDRAISAVPENRLHEHARRYFSRLFPDATIDFRAKTEGDQLGSIVVITHPDGSFVRYYIKTHSAGLKISHSSAAEEINPIELFVYKILEGFGVGCETHFFGRDKENCYIATRDANEDGAFTEYHRIKHNEEAKAPVWGVLSRVLTAPMVTEDAQRDTIESAIGEDPIAQNFMHQMSLLDLLARLMLLSDLQTNGHNFGFVHREGEMPRLRAIDFRLHNTDDFRITERDFGGFLVGNGFFNYYSADRAVCYALHDRAESSRVALARDIFETSLREWDRVIEEAKVAAREAFITSGLSEEDATKLSFKLNTHADILKANFALFERLLQGGEE